LKKERTSVLLNQEDMLKLKAISKRTNKSTSFLIQEAVTEFIVKTSPIKKIGIIGMVDSGDPNFARKDEEMLDTLISKED
jgi:predicted transcriptional regulator